MSRKKYNDSRPFWIIVAIVFGGYLLWHFLIQPAIIWVQGNWQTIIIILAIIILLAILAIIIYFKYRSSDGNKDIVNYGGDGSTSSPMSLEQFQDYFRAIHWTEFESQIADLLTKLNFQVILTQPSRDHGIDVIASKTDELGITYDYIIQCKQYENTPVGEPVLQQLLGNMHDTKPPRKGIIVCTSRLTKGAKEFADRNGIVNWDIDFLYQLYRKNS